MRHEVCRCRSVTLAKIAFQACAIDHWAISPFTISDLRLRNDWEDANCVRPPNVPRSLTGYSSIAAPLLLARRNGRGRVNPAALTCGNCFEIGLYNGLLNGNPPLDYRRFSWQIQPFQRLHGSGDLTPAGSEGRLLTPRRDNRGDSVPDCDPV